MPLQTPKLIRTTLERHVPAAAVVYALRLWEENRFYFKVTRNRATKLGDYRQLRQGRQVIHTISVNGGMNRYQFLITYVHEVAHMHVALRGRRVQPHGTEWKNTFRELMLPLLEEAVFPEPLLGVLARHMRNPKASSGADPALVRALNGEDPNQTLPLLEDLKVGEAFRFRGRVFVKGALRRTRVLVTDPRTQRKYLIPKIAEVEPVEI